MHCTGETAPHNTVLVIESLFMILLQHPLFSRDTHSKALVDVLHDRLCHWLDVVHEGVPGRVPEGLAQSVNLYWIYSITWINFFSGRMSRCKPRGGGAKNQIKNRISLDDVSKFEQQKTTACFIGWMNPVSKGLATIFYPYQLMAILHVSHKGEAGPPLVERHTTWTITRNRTHLFWIWYIAIRGSATLQKIGEKWFVLSAFFPRVNPIRA